MQNSQINEVQASLDKLYEIGDIHDRTRDELASDPDYERVVQENIKPAPYGTEHIEDLLFVLTNGIGDDKSILDQAKFFANMAVMHWADKEAARRIAEY